jgi:hypothetical protein
VRYVTRSFIGRDKRKMRREGLEARPLKKISAREEMKGSLLV